MGQINHAGLLIIERTWTKLF